MIEQFPTQVKVVFKQYPLRGHLYARQAARASIAAYRQGKFWPFHEALLKNYRQLNDQKVEEIRSKLKLDPDRFAKDMASDRTNAIIDKDIEDGRAAGVRGTPTVFVNGRKVRDNSLRGMRRAVQETLGRQR